MFPIINIGPFAIQAFGFILILGFLVGLWLSGIFAKNLGTHGESIENGLLIGLISGMIGARIGFFLQNPSLLSENPLAIFSLTPSLLDLPFGLFVAAVSGIVYFQKKHLPLWPTLDTLSPSLIFLFAAVHLANFANGNGYGLPTNLPWGIQLWNETRHPVQLYTLMLTMGFFVFLVIYSHGFKRTGFSRSGILINISLAAIGAITSFSRAFVADKIMIGNYDLWQLLGFGLLVFGIVNIYTRLYKTGRLVNVLISMGSNRDPFENLAAGLKKLQSQFKLHQSSGLYRTENVVGNKDSQSFLNQVIEIEVGLPYEELRSRLKAIEADLGRESGNQKDVPLDLDILTYGDDVFISNGKQIPDPNLKKYQYIAIPLFEIAPDFRHPANGKSISEIIEQLSETTNIQKINEVEDGFTS